MMIITRRLGLKVSQGQYIEAVSRSGTKREENWRGCPENRWVVTGRSSRGHSLTGRAARVSGHSRGRQFVGRLARLPLLHMHIQSTYSSSS